MSSKNMTITLTAREDGSVHYTFVDNDGNTKSSAFFVSPDATIGDRLIRRIDYELKTSSLITSKERPTDYLIRE